MKQNDKRKLILWLSAVVTAAVLCALQASYPSEFNLQRVLNPNHMSFWAIWLMLQCLCATLMIPSLPLVVFAAWCFPNQSFWVLLMSLVGVGLSASIIYRNVRWIELDVLMQGHPWAARSSCIVRERGAVGLALWCAAPVLPSDFGCYVAAGSGMKFGRYLTAVLAGECVLCASIIYGFGQFAH
jgi:uncharacterized membrane protein YdjX (TVP38/TMEM64 family)